MGSGGIGAGPGGAESTLRLPESITAAAVAHFFSLHAAGITEPWMAYFVDQYTRQVLRKLPEDVGVIPVPTQPPGSQPMFQPDFEGFRFGAWRLPRTVPSHQDEEARFLHEDPFGMGRAMGMRPGIQPTPATLIEFAARRPVQALASGQVSIPADPLQDGAQGEGYLMPGEAAVYTADCSAQKKLFEMRSHPSGMSYGGIAWEEGAGAGLVPGMGSGIGSDGRGWESVGANLEATVAPYDGATPGDALGIFRPSKQDSLAHTLSRAEEGGRRGVFYLGTREAVEPRFLADQQGRLDAAQPDAAEQRLLRAQQALVLAGVPYLGAEAASAWRSRGPLKVKAAGGRGLALLSVAPDAAAAADAAAGPSGSPSTDADGDEAMAPLNASVPASTQDDEAGPFRFTDSWLAYPTAGPTGALVPSKGDTAASEEASPSAESRALVIAAGGTSQHRSVAMELSSSCVVSFNAYPEDCAADASSGSVGSLDFVLRPRIGRGGRLVFDRVRVVRQDTQRMVAQAALPLRLRAKLRTKEQRRLWRHLLDGRAAPTFGQLLAVPLHDCTDRQGMMRRALGLAATSASLGPAQVLAQRALQGQAFASALESALASVPVAGSMLLPPSYTQVKEVYAYSYDLSDPHAFHMHSFAHFREGNTRAGMLAAVRQAAFEASARLRSQRGTAAHLTGSMLVALRGLHTSLLAPSRYTRMGHAPSPLAALHQSGQLGAQTSLFSPTAAPLFDEDEDEEADLATQADPLAEFVRDVTSFSGKRRPRESQDPEVRTEDAGRRSAKMRPSMVAVLSSAADGTCVAALAELDMLPGVDEVLKRQGIDLDAWITPTSTRRIADAATMDSPGSTPPARGEDEDYVMHNADSYSPAGKAGFGRPVAPCTSATTALRSGFSLLEDVNVTVLATAFPVTVRQLAPGEDKAPVVAVAPSEVKPAPAEGAAEGAESAVAPSASPPPAETGTAAPAADEAAPAAVASSSAAPTDSEPAAVRPRYTAFLGLGLPRSRGGARSLRIKRDAYGMPIVGAHTGAVAARTAVFTPSGVELRTATAALHAAVEDVLSANLPPRTLAPAIALAEQNRMPLLRRDVSLATPQLIPLPNARMLARGIGISAERMNELWDAADSEDGELVETSHELGSAEVLWQTAPDDAQTSLWR
jgi:hypothetical protein